MLLLSQLAVAGLTPDLFLRLLRQGIRIKKGSQLSWVERQCSSLLLRSCRRISMQMHSSSSSYMWKVWSSMA